MNNAIEKIINEERFTKIISETAKPSPEKVDFVLKKALQKKGLSLEDVGVLINIDNREALEKLFSAAGQVKQEIYGERLVLFAPLYISSYCVNDCVYCGFHCSNKAERRRLTFQEIEEQVKAIEDMGHKRILLECGEDERNSPIDFVVDAIETIYKTKSKRGEIRRVNVNIAATTIENYKKLKNCGIGTYQLFQETYHRPTYEKIHRGPKADFERQLFAHDQAFAAGIDDLGLGVLFGLYDWKFEILALLSHAEYMEKTFGVGPHTISVPRFQPAPTVDLKLEHYVSEEELLKIIAILRLAVPYTGLIISTRERPGIRAKAFQIGISQTSAGSHTEVGGYGNKNEHLIKQFEVSDDRSSQEIIKSILEQGLLPSFCTACYRLGRTGEKFMELAKPGEIHNFCLP
ncbi:MAG: [FeFe] hydrogenase H-cluster radical SAM maturase HydG, partial [Patescibacteria group bacterium]